MSADRYVVRPYGEKFIVYDTVRMKRADGTRVYETAKNARKMRDNLNRNALPPQ